MGGLEEMFTSLLTESDNERNEITVEHGKQDEADYVVVPDDEDDSSDDEEENVDESIEWDEAVKKCERWNFTDTCGLNHNLLEDCKEPIDFYKLFVNDDMFELIIKETNRYATSKDRNWSEITIFELRKFIALTIRMDIIKMPMVESYWSTDIIFGGSQIGESVMPWKRFEKLLLNLHFVDNKTNNKNDCLYKISAFLRIFVERSQMFYHHPPREVYISHSLVPFHGGTIIQEHIPNKQHRYGLKIYRLCIPSGYTYNMIVYAGNLKQMTGSNAEKVVTDLMSGLLDSGRTIFADSWCTTISLAKKLLRRKTNIVGTVRKSQKNLPKNFTEPKLKSGSFIARQSREGITLLRWKGKKDVLMLSTLHDASKDDTGKPLMTVKYNAGKSLLSFANEMQPYAPFIKKTTKWYIRIFFHVICQLAVINAWHIYNACFKNKMPLMDFKMILVRSWLTMPPTMISESEHTLQEIPGSKRLTNRRCVACYKELSQQRGASIARARAKQINTRCSKCKAHFCLSCFQSKHKIC